MVLDLGSFLSARVSLAFEILSCRDLSCVSRSSMSSNVVFNCAL
jgi:hypothetical protein